MTASVLVIIPTYDEAANVEMIVGRVRRATPDVDILVVDDASPDGTGAIADRLAAADSQVAVLHRDGPRGLGPAYLDGFAWGIGRDYEVLVEMDADGSHQPEQLHRLLDALIDADLVLGSRWVPGGGVRNWPRRRELLSRGGSLYARTLLGVPIRDITGGYRAIRRVTLDKLQLATVASAGYCFQVDLATRASRSGLRIVEVPITFVEREHGTSKMSRAIVAEALVRVTKWGVRHRGEQLRNRTRAVERRLRMRSAAMERGADMTRLLVFVAFLIVPLVEIFALIQVGQVIGPWWTILALVVDSLLGAWLVRREWRETWAALRAAIGSGQLPSRELADAALVIIGGTLLLTPGFVTDIVGFFFLLR